MLSKKEFVIVYDLKFIDRTNFMLSWAEHENFFLKPWDQVYPVPLGRFSGVWSNCAEAQTDLSSQDGSFTPSSLWKAVYSKRKEFASKWRRPFLRREVKTIWQSCSPSPAPPTPPPPHPPLEGVSIPFNQYNEQSESWPRGHKIFLYFPQCFIRETALVTSRFLQIFLAELTPFEKGDKSFKQICLSWNVSFP